jgi:hypothetical protein
MATRKKNDKKRRPMKKSAGKKVALRKKPGKKKAAARTAAPKKRARKKAARRGKSDSVASLSFEPAGLGARSGGQSGDLQGLSNVGGADSESVDELLEEGSAFEAEAVKGVEDAPDADEGEVRTHEVPEDEVPEEYQDNEP